MEADIDTVWMIYNIDSAYNNDDSIIFVVLTILVTATIIIACFVCIYIYIYIYIYVCVCIYLCMYIYLLLRTPNRLSRKYIYVNVNNVNAYFTRPLEYYRFQLKLKTWRTNINSRIVLNSNSSSS